MKKTCETCAAFEPIYEGGIGECRLNPPVFTLSTIHGLNTFSDRYEISSDFEFPEVTEAHWCCQWRKKEDEEHEAD